MSKRELVEESMPCISRAWHGPSLDRDLRESQAARDRADYRKHYDQRTAARDAERERKRGKRRT